MAEEYTRQDEQAQIKIESWTRKIEQYLDDDPELHPLLNDLLGALIDDLYDVGVKLDHKLHEWRKENGR